ncbi:hypothetical protein Desmer_0659 [Desulfosporosinus meridiei DSM 13257]|uniref:Uncharacterized protein n=1 Tax=Desulfosporosinus meridiei (strain ATCC BAA-275 / DSM 13257 / KCTC 12902 / NCIMB 13706 / S10) TaxID=768704 RepID=J7ILM8_DESMD|nr:hypothetical protein Desmer_0659 [Desulfosporosinus meridiei DSM 13257]
MVIINKGGNVFARILIVDHPVLLDFLVNWIFYSRNVLRGCHLPQL